MFRTVLIITISLFSSAAFSQNPILLRDFNTTPLQNGSNPRNFFEFNGKLYFSANDQVHGYELWETDGTTSNRLTDINPQGSSMYQSTVAIPSGDTITFYANDGINGYQPWQLDSNNNITPGNPASLSYYTTLYNNEEYSIAHDGNYWQLRKKVGNGYEQVSNTSNGVQLAPLVVLNNLLYYISIEGQTRTIYQTNGTPSGTVPMGDNAVNPDRLILLNNRFFFSATNASGRELWSSDGTAQNTAMLFDLNNSNQNSLGEHQILRFNGQILFASLSGGLYKLGAQDQAVLIKSGLPTANLSGHAETPNLLYLFFNYGTNTVWVTDGNEDGINTRSIGNKNSTQRFAIIDDTVYFYSQDYKLMVSSGDVATEVPGIQVGWAPNMLTVNGKLYVSAYGPDEDEKNIELWVIDNAGANPRKVSEINTTSSTDADILEFIGSTGNYVLFTRGIEQGVDQYQMSLWASQGTPATTRHVTDLPSFVTSQYDVRASARLGNSFVFELSRNSEIPGENDVLWISDGTTNGTREWVSDVENFRNQYVPLGDNLLFSALRGGNYTLHRAERNGTGSFEISTEALDVRNLLLFNGDIYFTGKDAQNNMALWKTINQGTAITKLVTLPDAQARYSMETDNTSLFIRMETDTQVVYYSSDGSTSPLGERVVYSKFSPADRQSGGNFALGHNDRVYVRKYSGRETNLSTFWLLQANGISEVASTTGEYLNLVQINDHRWVINNFDRGDVVRELSGNQINPLISYPPSIGPFVNNLMEYDSLLYFIADGGQYSRQIWSTDGTLDNTQRITDLSKNGLYRGMVGDTNSGPGRMIVGPGGLYIVADDGFTGKELYFMQLTPDYVPADPPRSPNVVEPKKSGATSPLFILCLMIIGILYRLNIGQRPCRLRRRNSLKNL